MNGQEQSERKRHQMINQPVERLVVTLAIPTILSMLVSSVYNMADTFFVSRLGTSATGAVGICFSVMAVIQAIGFTFGQGAGNTVSRLLGRQDRDEAVKVASTGFFSAFGLSALLAVIGSFFVVPLVRLLGATETITPYAADYLRYLFIGMPFISSSFVLNNLLRYQGNAAYAMVGIMTGAVLNIALDPLLIYTFDLGVGGASLATAISQLVSFVILLIQSTRGGNITPSLRHFSWQPGIHLTILKNGAPTLLRQGLASVAAIVLNTSASAFGDAAIAAMAIVSRVLMFGLSALLGFGQGFQPVCGFNYGAGRYDRVNKAFWFSVKITTSILVVFSLVGLLVAPEVIAFFQKEDPEVIRIGAAALRYHLLALPLLSFTILAMMMTQTIGASAKASVLALARQGMFFVPLVYVLPRLIGIPGLQISQPISDVLSFLLSLILTIPLLKSLAKPVAVSAPEDSLPAVNLQQARQSCKK